MRWGGAQCGVEWECDNAQVHRSKDAGQQVKGEHDDAQM